jgi:hypothetical protein
MIQPRVIVNRKNCKMAQHPAVQVAIAATTAKEKNNASTKAH